MKTFTKRSEEMHCFIYFLLNFLRHTTGVKVTSECWKFLSCQANVGLVKLIKCQKNPDVEKGYLLKGGRRGEGGEGDLK